MKFSTKIPIPISKNKITYDSKIVSLGSCFAENIGSKFEFYKFQSVTNPFGIIFNPISIEKIVQRAVQNQKITTKDIFYYNELWHSFEVHSSLSNPDKFYFINQFNELLEQFYHQIFTASHILITYGTAWVYRNIESNTLVANCHKVPAQKFTKELLPISTIAKSIENTISQIQTINPNCNFIFTISPVRHIKDGFVENQLSKSHLIAALHKVLHKKKATTYFPSYEIMMDELRDYRFYTADMLHPSAVAVDYIWEQFVQTQIETSTFATMQKIETIQKSIAHRSFNIQSENYQKFQIQLKEKITQLTAQYPFIKF